MPKRRRLYKKGRYKRRPRSYIVRRVNRFIRDIGRSLERNLWRLIKQSFLQGIIESIISPILMYYQAHYTWAIVILTPILGVLLVIASSLRLLYRIDYRLHGFFNMLTEVGVKTYVPRLIHNLSLCTFSLLIWKLTSLEGSFQLATWCLYISIIDFLLTLLARLEQV